jgi:catechol 2,3-dioxygenase-like lactoylglutathione lyase family enzyme
MMSVAATWARLAAILVGAALVPHAGAAELPNDPLEPIASGAEVANANTGPLSGAIVVTRDLPGIRRAYVDGVGLTLSGPVRLRGAQRRTLAKLWQMPAGLGWDLYTLHRPAVPDSIRVAVIVPESDTPVIRASHAREETGPYALGFAMRDTRAADARVVALGFTRTLPAVNEYLLQLRDGTPYPVVEASYEIADNTRLVLMQRGGNLPPIGGVDPATGLGGPSYSSLIVEDAAAMEQFFTEVLDLERRTNREWTIFSPRFRYLTLHARGARTGNIGLVEYAAADRRAGTGVAPRPPNRGLAGWSFPVKRLDDLLRRARARGVTIISAARGVEDPRFGPVRMATLVAPNGLLIEVYERR